jgi:hypothetical protein
MKAFWSKLALLFTVFVIVPVSAIGQTTQKAENTQVTSSPSSNATASAQATTSSQAAPPVTQPELVRLSYVQGDVTFNRGNGKGPDLKKPWEQADINLPIERGYAVATGDSGRAEVEFETGGVIYLAENSVLLFKQLTSTGGVPSTQIELASGTLTTNIAPIQGEFFVIEMPDGRYQIVNPEHSYMRIDSYLDGMAFTPQTGGAYYYKQGAGPRVTLEKGQTGVWESGEPMRIEGAGQSVAPNGFDNWVAERYAARETSMEAALKASG